MDIGGTDQRRGAGHSQQSGMAEHIEDGAAGEVIAVSEGGEVEAGV